ncbi:pectate lyase [Sphingomonas parva]|uniref:Pectate lyase n=2 Tax=Sphingomonas parva TaxID=2555898 RepID=A0A4Y8ZNQ4_9SPHN|nr:pectate lyase [Sphingomonas parva]
MAADKAALAAERRTAPRGPWPDRGGGGNAMPLDRADAWYAGPEARRVADNIVSFQTPAGGWGKNQNRATPPRVAGEGWAIVEHLPPAAAGDIQADKAWAYVGTLDNGATTSELRFLARVQAQLPGTVGARYRAAFLKGVRYLLAAQYPNGGWPQVFPLQGGYHDAITFNDDAVADAARLLDEVGRRSGATAFVPDALAGEARSAAARAIAMLLATQVRVDGRRTIWAQQHDALSLAPVGARAFEPAALSSAESAGILRFLMEVPEPSAELAASVCDGIAWLRAHALADVAWNRAEGRLDAQPGAAPLWARFYDLHTARPIFGDRGGTIHDDIADVSEERRRGYSWFNAAPAGAFSRFERWRARHQGRAAVQAGCRDAG